MGAAGGFWGTCWGCGRAQGGTVTFEGHSVASSGSNSIASGEGLGGRLIFRENASATGSFNNYGAGTLDAGNEAVTQLLDDARLDGFAQNFGGTEVGTQGGRTEFRQCDIRRRQWRIHRQQWFMGRRGRGKDHFL